MLFDLDGPLVWQDAPIIDAGRRALAVRACVDADALAEQWRRTLDRRMRGAGSLEEQLAEMLAGCGRSPDPALIAELARMDYATWSRGVRLYEDASPLLRLLRRRGLRTAIVSNCACQTAACVAHLGLARAVDTVVLSCDVGVLKPDPTIFRIALERLGVPPADALFVDDRPENLDGAREIGMRTVLIARDPASAPTADHPRVSALAELSPLLAEAPWTARSLRGR